MRVLAFAHRAMRPEAFAAPAIPPARTKEPGPMQQQISVITLGVADLAVSRHFYTQGFGWRPVFESDDILFYQMNGFVFGTWQKTALAEDMQRPPVGGAAAFALAHNVGTQAEVTPLIDALVAAGGTLLRAADAPPHGAFRGYVADPDGHAWEIAWNPDWPIDAEGHVTFAA
jgi:catechol 2,3-dioxygenase-like lactoylglutathione lyase family enzyme